MDFIPPFLLFKIHNYLAALASFRLLCLRSKRVRPQDELCLEAFTNGEQVFQPCIRIGKPKPTSEFNRDTTERGGENQENTERKTLLMKQKRFVMWFRHWRSGKIVRRANGKPFCFGN
jgi:hypothetical protein